MSQLDQLPAGAMVRARPWDVIGAGLAAPMILWGFLGWFGSAGDSGGGLPGFYSGTGAAGIGLVLAAAALVLHQILSGTQHQRTSPPVAAFLAGAASIVMLGGMVAKPDSATIQAGSVAGLLTALTQGAVLVRGWLQGSEKSVKAANVRALHAQQAAADQAAGFTGGYGSPGFSGPAYPASGPAGYPYRSPYPPAAPPPTGYPPAGFSGGQAPGYSQGYPPLGYPPAGQPYPPGGYPYGSPQPPPPSYPQQQYPQQQYPPVPQQSGPFQGPQGPQGPQGTQGPQGPQGPQGQQYRSGPPTMAEGWSEQPGQSRSWGPGNQPGR